MQDAAIPRLVTRRLILRAPVVGDFAGVVRLLASQRAAYMGGPYDGRAAWGVFCHGVALWRLFGHGALSIELAATGECIGEVQINHGPLFPEKELGWQVHDGFEGHGYATEAAAALRDWAYGAAGLGSLVSYIHPGNTRSAAVARRLGAVPDHAAPRQDPDDLVFRHCRADAAGDGQAVEKG